MADNGEKKLLLKHLTLFKQLNDGVSVGSVKVENGSLKTYAIDGTLIKEQPLSVGGDGIQVPKASATEDGLMSKEDFAKLQGVSHGANKVTYDGINGHLTIDGVDTTIYEQELMAPSPLDAFNNAFAE